MTWNLIDSLRMDPWRGRAWERSRPRPAVNVFGNDDKVVVTTEVPGLDPKDLDVNVHGRVLTVSGVMNLPELKQGEALTTNERPLGEFSRSLTLPYPVEADQVCARYEFGVLTVTLPRAERDKPRKIAIKAA